MDTFARRARFSVYLLLWLWLAAAPIAQSGQYFPPRGSWAKKSPAELGLDPAKLAEAISFAQSRETTRAIDFSDQERTFGSLLGSLPTRRGKTNGLVILVIVWRWHAGNEAERAKRVIAAIK